MCQIFIIDHFYRETWITMNSQFFSVGVYCYAVIVASCAVEAGRTLPIKLLAESEYRNLTNEGIGTSQTDIKSDLNSESSSKILFYSEWSPWSSCLDSCERTRQRRCQNKEKCGNIELKETSVCDNPQSKRTKRKCHRTHNRRKHRHKNHEFHVVQLTTDTNPQRPDPNLRRNSQKSHSNPQSSLKDKLSSSTNQQLQHRQSVGIASPEGSWYHREQRHEQSRMSSSSDVSAPQKESPVIFQNAGGKIQNRDRHAHKYVSKLYGKWSRWSQCTRSCTTHRRRSCKRKSICGADVIREAAYCYVEGSYCQRWIQRKIRKNEEENEAAQDPYTDVYPSSASSKGRGMTYSSPIPQEHPAAGECGVAGNTSSRSSLGNMLRIIGGRPTSRGRWPWQVAVLNRFREAFCGGTLVSPRWVLTAAHCVRKRLYVRLGEHDLSEKDGTELEFRIDYVVQHPSYDSETVDNDVALLRLPLAVHPDRYRGLACLPRSRQALPTSQYCTIIGWGKRVSSDLFGTDVLHEAEVPIVSNDVCRRVYQDYHITGNMFCAGYRRGRMDSCAGDSGGPLLCREGDKWTIFGITSFGEGCGKRGKYGIYTRLSNYIKWIQKTIKEEN